MARDTSGPRVPGHPSADGLAWKGAGKPLGPGGGFVGSVGLNEPVSRPLAVDPEGTVAAKTARRDAPAGPQLTVEAMKGPEDDRVRPSGRIKMPIG